MISTHWRAVHQPSARELRLLDVLARQAADLIERKEVEDALHESEEQLRAALAAGKLGTWRLDLTTGVLDSSATCKANFGLPPDADLSYQTLLALIHPEDRAAMRAAVERAVTNRTDYEAEYRIFWPDGSTHWIVTRGRGLYDRGDAPFAIVGVTADITVRKEAEAALRESEEHFRRLFEDTEVPTALVAVDGRFLRVNRAWCACLGYSEQELLGLTVQDITLPEDWTLSRFPFRQALAGVHDAYQIERRYSRKNGAVMWMVGNATLLRDSAGSPLYFIAQGQDITARKEAEDALAQHARELERTNADLRQVAYVSAHDLQEPVRQMGLYTQKLAKRYRDALDAETQEAVGFIVEAAQRMATQFTDFTHYLEVDEKGPGVSTTDCEEVWRRTLKALQDPITASGATITHDPLPTLAANPAQLQLVLQELLENALKFRNNAPPRVHVWAEREERGWRFAVRDNGIGIDPQWTGQLFGFFRRLHPRQQYPGTGMGLAICRKIVERHGGRIWVESQPGQGATFLFTISEKSSQ